MEDIHEEDKEIIMVTDPMTQVIVKKCTGK